VNVIFEYHYMLLIVQYIYNFRGTCLSVQTLKGYRVMERLGIPGIKYALFWEMVWKPNTFLWTEHPKHFVTGCCTICMFFCMCV